MSAESYIDSKMPELLERSRIYGKTLEVISLAESILSAHAFIDDEGYVKMPELNWDTADPDPGEDDSHAVWLRAADGEGYTLETLSALPCLFEFIVCFPSETHADAITAFSIDVMNREVRDFAGRLMSLFELDGVMADLQKYEAAIAGNNNLSSPAEPS